MSIYPFQYGAAQNEGLDVLVTDQRPRFFHAQRLPEEFWRARPQPVLEIQTPDVELEEGVPWSVQLLLRPISGVDLLETLETLRERQSQKLFPDSLVAEALDEMRGRLDTLAERLPALRRAMNMADGRASLNRQELASGYNSTIRSWSTLKRSKIPEFVQ